MATLNTASFTGLTVNGNTVWRSSNATGQNSTINADMIGGYNLNYIASYNSFNNGVWQNLTSLDWTAAPASLSTFYPLVIDGARNADGTCGLDLRRTSVHQDGGGYGAFFGTIRYRAGNTNFWEITENWGSGTYYPFVANVQCSTTDNQVAIWIRGGVSYYYRFHSQESFTSTALATSRSFSGSTISTTTTVSVPSSSHYYQHNICSQGYNLGQSSFNWGTVYSVSAISASSDGRTKENIGITFGKDFVMKLKPRSYTLKPHPNWTNEVTGAMDTRRQHGLVAQEVKEAMDAVGIAEEDFGGYDAQNPDFLHIRYDEFIPILTKAIQEQFIDLEDLEHRVNVLEEMA
jgi:hypothetical protein